MHRATERRWVNFFLFMLVSAAVFQLLGFVLPNWLRAHFMWSRRRAAQDYALWYVTQCEGVNWTCTIRSYHRLYDWTRGKYIFDGIELLLDADIVASAQVLYTLGLLLLLVAFLPLTVRRRLIVSKRTKADPANYGLLTVAGFAFFSGLFVMIAAGKMGTASVEHRNGRGAPVALGFAAAGGAIALMTGIFVLMRVFLKGYCPDCTPVSRDIDMHETTNQVDVMVSTEKTDVLRRQSDPIP
ncbi:uncharacterized protein LOC128207723 [Mya arenaria]|nr:uncharacterized protein LOC128207723 [Mya arenaria]